MRYLVSFILGFTLYGGVTSCGPLGNNVSESWKCMIEGGEEYCGAEAGKDTRSTGKSDSPGIPGPTGPTGPQGPQGTPGERGTQGTPGSSCTVTPMQNGAILSCTDGTSVAILNGSNGVNGTNATQSAYTITQLVDPCGKQGQFDEVLLRTANGTLLAHYSSGGKEFLAVLSPGNYRTTDSTSCFFTVNSDGTISNEHN